MKKYHILYETTCLVNGKTYIGIHSTNKIDDGYIGGGIYSQAHARTRENCAQKTSILTKAVLKYGYENFKRSVLAICSTRKDVAFLEEVLVNKKWIKSSKNYNASLGGEKSCRPLINSEEIIKRFRKTHGEKYDYSETIYMGAHIKVSIKCRKHGFFWQLPHSHSKGSGCPKCAITSVPHKQDKVIDHFKRVHGDTYDYSKVKFIKNDKPVCIVCPVHGDFYQRPYAHKSGNGCKACGSGHTAKLKVKSKSKVFVNKLIKKYGVERYDFSKIVYSGVFSEVTVVCKIHGEFKIKPLNTYSLKNICEGCRA